MQDQGGDGGGGVGAGGDVVALQVRPLRNK